MKRQKLDQLFGQARKAQAPPPPADFEADVLRAVRRESRITDTEPVLLFDMLGAWFPRLALVAALVITLSVIADFTLGAAGVPNLNEAVAQASEQLLFDLNGI